jgi:uncharacterized heparinase superfamily protein
VSRPSAGTLLRTVRHLRARQVVHQALHLLRGADVRPRPFPGETPQLAVAAAAPFLPAPRHARCDGRGGLELLNREVHFVGGIDWRHADEGPLWAYHLHQFDWARSPDLAPRVRAELLLDWIERHRRGVGWQPAPISLRALSWLKLLLAPGALVLSPDEHARVRASFAAQLDTLSSHLEVRLLANHYFSNLLALVAGGLAFAGPAADRWLRHSRAFRRELDEQVLPDGAHAERSPMYHALLLENVLDVLNLAHAAPRRAPAGLAGALAGTASRMLAALRIYTHPDGEIALFADSALGIAHAPGEIERYAASLGVAAQRASRPGVLECGGYVRLERGPWSLLVSVAGPAPAWQPGHAHGDALAFELCVGTQRVVMDTGVAEYVPGPLRDRSRATRSHATLEVGGRDQAELWAAHRVGGRPRVRLEAIEPGRRVEATCAGWATPDSLHRRALELDERELRVVDRVEGRARPVRLVLPLAPGLEPSLDGARARLLLAAGGSLAIALPDAARWSVEPLDCYPEFGLRLVRKALVGAAEGPGPFAWRFALEA